MAAVDRERVGDVPYTASVYQLLFTRGAIGLAVVAVIMLLVTPGLRRLMAGSTVPAN